ncbi:MAG: nucleotide exchange factor GrpE [Fretibacterium sp.]|nr:nucleotide exchange factor GrpE [Fretibacterium sp.]
MENEMGNEYFEPVIEGEDEEKENPELHEDNVLIPEDGDPEETLSDKKSESESKVENPDERITALEQELAASRADFYNYRQRVTREKQEARRRTEEDVITALLPVLDNLDRALMVPEDGSARDVLVGVRMVQRQFLSALEELGVSVIPTEGQRFDANFHEAVGTVPADTPEQDGAVVNEQLRGYRTKEGRVLRAARVIVGKAE